MGLTAVVQEAQPKPLQGLKDKGHIPLVCSNCNAILMDLWIIADTIDPATGKPFEWKVRAICPWCGDKSFIETIHGRFTPAGAGVVKEDDPETAILSTIFDPPEEENGVYVFPVLKANKNAKPIYRQ